MPDPTLLEWAGGPARIRALMDAFYDRVEGDDLLSPFFPGGVHEAHRAHVTVRTEAPVPRWGWGVAPPYQP